MKKTVNLTESSDLFNKIVALPLQRSDRIEAMDALIVADKLTAALYWMVTKIQQLAAWLNPHPKFKPE